MKFIDTHCHFDFPPFIDDFDANLCLAKMAGITHIIVPAVTADRFDTILKLAQQSSMILPALGLHPLYIEQHTSADLEYLSNLLNQQQRLLAQINDQTKHDQTKIVAIGEIGLDNFMASPNLAKQVEFLHEQISLANTFNLPVLLHSRRTHDLLLKQLKQHPVKRAGILHGYSGSYQQALEFVKLGYKIGVGGTITYPRASKTRHAISKLPLESLVLETDAPDMPIMGRQGTPNHPAYLPEIFEVLKTLRPESEQIIAKQIHLNVDNLFDHPLF